MLPKLFKRPAFFHGSSKTYLAHVIASCALGHAAVDAETPEVSAAPEARYQAQQFNGAVVESHICSELL